MSALSVLVLIAVINLANVRIIVGIYPLRVHCPLVVKVVIVTGSILVGTFGMLKFGVAFLPAENLPFWLRVIAMVYFAMCAFTPILVVAIFNLTSEIRSDAQRHG